MKKPDRWERLVVNQYSKWHNEVGDTAKWHNADVIKLLRQEHAWVRRMLKELREFYKDRWVNYDNGWQQALVCAEERLKERAK